MARKGETSFAGLVFRIVVIAALLYGGFEFLKWDESDRDEGIEYIAPYTLYYRYKGEDKGYQHAQSWYVSFDLSFVEPSWSKDCEQMISFATYETLSEASARAENNGLVFNPVWTYQSKLTESTRCEVRNFFTQQPTEETVRKKNTITYGKSLVAKFEQKRKEG